MEAKSRALPELKEFNRFSNITGGLENCLHRLRNANEVLIRASVTLGISEQPKIDPIMPNDGKTKEPISILAKQDALLEFIRCELNVLDAFTETLFNSIEC